MHAVFVCAFSVAFYKYFMLRNMTGETQFFTLKTIIVPYKLPRLCFVITRDNMPQIAALKSQWGPQY